MSDYKLIERGSKYGTDYRVYFEKNDVIISPWHAISLYADERNRYYSMLIEVPLGTNAKFEIATNQIANQAANPICQNVKKGEPRFVHNIWPFSSYLWNYGSTPQTWESLEDGDNDPLDVVDISGNFYKTESVAPVKVLGCLGQYKKRKGKKNNGLIDWKIIAIGASDHMAVKLNDIKDVEKNFCRLLKGTLKWFRDYKPPEHKGRNEFVSSGYFTRGHMKYFFESKQAENIIKQRRNLWNDRIRNRAPQNGLKTTYHVEGAAFRADKEAWDDMVNKQPPLAKAKQVPLEISKWYFKK